MNAVRVYWLDLCDSGKGSMLMIGKTFDAGSGRHVSCCVEIRGAEKIVFFAYRSDDVSTEDMYSEVSKELANSGILSFKCKTVFCKYLDTSGASNQTESRYLKVVYSSSSPNINISSEGVCFSMVIGSRISNVDRFIMKRRLMGPSWVEVINPIAQEKQISYCKMDLYVMDQKNLRFDIAQELPPPLDVLTVNFTTRIGPNSGNNEVVAISGIYNDEESFSIVCRLSENPLQGCSPSIMPTERSLISAFIAKVSILDPDIINGHGLVDFDIDTLFRRMKEYGIAQWSKAFSRIVKTSIPKSHGETTRASYQQMESICGRLICDLKVCASEIMRIGESRLESMVESILGPESVTPEIYEMEDSALYSPNGIDTLRVHSAARARVIHETTKRIGIIPLCVQITRITGGILRTTFLSGPSVLNDYMLCHEFHNHGYILPDKPVKRTRDSESYTGGLVLEPKIGIYRTGVVVMDFCSLYPSIIREYNICFTTRGDSKVKGVLPMIVSNLISERSSVKNAISAEMKKTDPDANVIFQLNIKQLAFKLTANSMYGCLGFASSRFYSRDIAASITSKGREALNMAVKTAEGKFAVKVIYGDTDSIMIDTMMTDPSDMISLCKEIVKKINATYKFMRMEIDHVFKTMLLLKKKKYAALEITRDGGTRRHMKGVDMVHIDSCKVSKEAGIAVLDMILKGMSLEELRDECTRYIDYVCRNLSSRDVSDFVICKRLSRHPEAYKDRDVQPHVRVAMSMKSLGKRVYPHDTIPYIICDNGTNSSAVRRAFHPDVVVRDGLTVDVKYYESNQIIPVVRRLLEPVGLMDCVGKRCNQAVIKEMVDECPVKQVYIACPTCSEKQEFDGSTECRMCSTRFDDLYICERISAFAQGILHDYDSSKTRCKECNAVFDDSIPVCECGLETEKTFDWKSLQLQLVYIKSIVKKQETPIIYDHVIKILRERGIGVLKLSSILVKK